MEQITGAIESIVFQSDDNSFCVLRIESRSNGRFTAVYHGPSPYIGENVEVEGDWIEHPRFGQQLDIKVLHMVEPTSVAGIQNFLGSGALKGIGKALAKRIVDKFGIETLTVLNECPDRLAEVKGISPKKAAAIGDAYSELSDLRELMLFLEAHGVSSNYATKLHTAYGSTAIARIKENPYNLATDIDGIGFRTADRIAMAMGVPRDSEERLIAGLSYALTQSGTAGHTCVPEELLVKETARALMVETDAVQEIFNSLMQRNLLRTEEMGGLRLVYAEYLYRAEVQTAKRLLALRDQAKPIQRVNADAVIAAWEKEAGIVLADEQREAIYASLQHGVLVLTGGPGTGKSATRSVVK